MTSPALTVSTPVSRHDIQEGLRQLGAQPGDALEVHSSLSSFGWVEGGAGAVVDALMHIVGPDGALVMSAYPISLPLPLTDAERARGIQWKVQILPENSAGRAGMGAIAYELCQRPGAVLGAGVHRVCAWGRDAEMHSRGYQHLLDVDGRTLLLGVDIHRCSSMHIAEGHVGMPAEIAQIFLVPDEIRSAYPDDIYIGYGSTPDDAWAKVQQEAEHRGLIRRRCIGRAECMLFKAKAVVSIYEEVLHNDPFGLFGLENLTPSSSRPDRPPARAGSG